MRFIYCLSLLPILASCSDNDSQALQCPAPLAHWRKPADGIDHHAQRNLIEVRADGGILWNKQLVTEKTVTAWIKLGDDMFPRPFLILDPAPGATCGDIVRVRALMNAEYCKEKWACGEGKGPWQPVMFAPDAELSRELEAAADNAAMDAPVAEPD